MRRGALLGLFAAGLQIALWGPALAQITVNIEPSRLSGSAGPVVHYLTVAPKTASNALQGSLPAPRYKQQRRKRPAVDQGDDCYTELSRGHTDQARFNSSRASGANRSQSNHNVHSAGSMTADPATSSPKRYADALLRQCRRQQQLDRCPT
jgi:hypothetical protein